MKLILYSNHGGHFGSNFNKLEPAPKKKPLLIMARVWYLVLTHALRNLNPCTATRMFP